MKFKLPALAWRMSFGDKDWVSKALVVANPAFSLGSSTLASELEGFYLIIMVGRKHEQQV